jgi:hypothetical protein
MRPGIAELQARKALAAELPLKRVLREHKVGVLLSMALTAVVSSHSRGDPDDAHLPAEGLCLSPAVALQANSLAIVT